MSTFKTYSDKLLSPLWQKRRLEILQRDNWTCQRCGNTKETLHVHHKKYSGANPWDAPDEDMETICSTCHIKEHFPETEPVAPVDPEKVLLGEINRAAPHWYKAYPDLAYPPPDLVEMYKERQMFSNPEIWKGLNEAQENELLIKLMDLSNKIRLYGKPTN